MSIESAEDTNSRRRRPVKILLYTLITTTDQQIPIDRNRWQWIRTRLVRLIYLALWKLTGQWKAKFWMFKDIRNSNFGDIAVRMGVSHALEKAFGNRKLEFHELTWGKLTTNFVAELPRDFDLIVIAGGGYLFADQANKLPKRVIDDIRALEKAKCPVVATSIGLNQLIHESTAIDFSFDPGETAKIRQFIDRLALCSVRDETTRKAIELAGARSPQVIVDPGFLLANPDSKIEKTDDGVLDIGINLSFHGTFASKLSERSLIILVRVLERLQRTIPCRFHYFCHADSSKGIVAAIRTRGLKLQVVGGSVDQLIAGYQKLDIHVGSMMHSTILAMSVGVPSLSLAYDIKSAGFFELFGLGHFVKDVQKIDEESLFDAIMELIARRREVAAMLAERGSQLRARADVFFADVARLVGCFWVGVALPGF
ncbi:MAG TPA: polysaccharide pyruvyl transferase family protein [Rhizomicrobium sp.]|nr:polysaccharide pyruvyl transferase family protein [Rhizomicrobium sp.]